MSDLKKKIQIKTISPQAPGLLYQHMKVDNEKLHTAEPSRAVYGLIFGYESFLDFRSFEISGVKNPL